MLKPPLPPKNDSSLSPKTLQDVPHKGFALIIALSLMAFVILLLVSMSTLVRVESQSSTIAKKTLEARSNAILGLSVALGELQKYAGPDQRSTTAATVTTALNSNSQDGTRHWTAVWGNTAPDGAATAPVLLNWLVSGNQGQALTLSTDGRVLPPASGAIDYRPETPVVINRKSARIDNLPAAVLVGDGSVALEADYVVAPIMPIEGITSGGVRAGGYAYWIGDEGVKAHIGLVKGAARALDPASSDLGLVAIRRIQANQSIRSSGELVQVDPNSAALWGTGYNLSAPAFVGEIGKLLDFAGLKLVSAVPQALADNRLHDLTLVSQGLQTNSLQGGLKTDLSLAFEMPEADFEQTNMMRTSEGGHVVRHEGVYGPKWKLLRDFYRLYKEIESPTGFPLLETRLIAPLPPEDPDLGIPYLFGDAAGDPLRTRETSGDTIEGQDVSFPRVVRTATFPEKMKLAPVVADLKYLISVDTESVPSQVVATGAGGTIQADRQMRLVFDPIVKLWNPYNVRLKFDAFTIRCSHLPIGFRWEIDYPTNSSGTNLNYVNPPPGDVPGFISLRGIYSKYYGGNFANWGNWLDSIVVSIGDPNGIVLEPGEVRIFSSGESAPVPFLQEMDLVAGWEDRGGYEIDVIDPDNANNHRLFATEDTRFAVTMTNRSSPGASESGWQSFRMSTYLFSEGEYNQRHNVKNTGSSNFYNTAYYHFGSNGLPFLESGVPTSDMIRSPSNGRWPLPIPGEKQYLLSIEMSLKAEDELSDPLPFAQFSPTAYVNSTLQNSLNGQVVRVGPAHKINYRKVNNQVEADIQFDPGGRNRAFYGSSHGTTGQTHVPILDIPQAPLFSLGQLQSADTSIYAVDPLLAIGNSFASPLLPPDQLTGVTGALSGQGEIGRSRMDMPYLLNRTLWDDYFFSTIAPQDSTLFSVTKDIEEVFDGIFTGGETALNPNFTGFDLSLHEAKPNLFSAAGTSLRIEAPQRSAAFLLQHGQFNLNSTSLEAWKGILGSSLGAQIPYVNPGTGLIEFTNEVNAPVSRFSLPLTSLDATNRWEGYRSLTPAEIAALAAAVVDEIREHGPFLSLSDFVNRDPGTNTRGLLDRAIEAANINNAFTETVEPSDVGYLPASARGNVTGLRGQGAAKFLLQGDVLSLIGQRLVTRSDTFRIRSYGDAVDPISNEVQASAWVEAIVQRMPEYTNAQANDPWDAPTGDNIKFGRRFIITSVRFLSDDDI
jgi:hypothetical protein